MTTQTHTPNNSIICKLIQKESFAFSETYVKNNILIGYNYYIVVYINNELKKQKCFYSSIDTSDPFDLNYHDMNAKKIYNEILGELKKL